MNIVFAGTPAFSVPTLQALIDSEHQVVGVFTQPDRPKGRGRQVMQSPVKALALSHQIPVYQPTTCKNTQAQEALAQLQPDVMVVVAYGLILPKDVLAIPKYGCLNVHASLLPRWRGASPIQQAILSGDEKTGVSIMQMEVGLDSGPVYKMIDTPVSNKDTSQSLHDRLSELGTASLLDTLAELRRGEAKATPQDEANVTLAPKIQKQDAALDWQLSAEELDRRIRAYFPWPVATLPLQNQVVRVLAAVVSLQTTTAKPGDVVEMDKHSIAVATGNQGVLHIQRLQLPGGKPITAQDYINAYCARS